LLFQEDAIRCKLEAERIPRLSMAFNENNINNNVGVTVREKPWSLFHSFLAMLTAGRTPSARDQSAARLLSTQDNKNIE
jgi:hypothetical protein